ncbi:putative glycosyltransferase [Cupriavidus sp. TKC]|uniref:glycosyltransferase family 4 protein n=1 Tax=unclassified Cupriavidus TaxID=2640874 RepID=UPI0002A338AC|nr:MULTISPECIES: glycosyltransferase family 4 protein [unclassified Cupriavidus]ELA00689.1 glycosyl transferase group 1 [Cupriavidus sp. HMR-1]GMG90979.1 putative glycosyltransferase [Cupriavidus sp. TKC]
MKDSIAFLTGTLNALAGAERMTATIGNALAERGHRIIIISLWDARSAFPLHPAVTHIALFAQRPSLRAQYPATLRKLRALLRKHHVHTLIEVDTMLAWFTLPATLGLGIRRIGWEHCHYDEDLGHRARRVARHLTARFHDAVIVLTESDRKRWIDAARPRGDVLALPNPLPFPLPDSPSIRSAKQVLAVGRLVDAKGFDILIRAWAEIAPLAPDWTLVIVGEGEARPMLEALRESLGMTGFVQLPGARSDIRDAYQQASIFCLSSRYEGFGLVLIEAMAFGLPVVSTDCETGPRALLEDGRNALVVPVDDAQALAKALLTLMRDEKLAAQLSSGALACAMSFELNGIVDRWEVLLNRVYNLSEREAH